MFLHQLQDVLALEEEGYLLGFDELLMVLPGPAAFFHPGDIHRIDPEVLLFALSVDSAEGFLHHLLKGLPIEPVAVDGQLLDLGDHELLLLLDDVADPRVVDGGVDIALHHGPSFVVLDVSFPPLGGHSAFLTEALLPEVAQGQIVGIGHQVLYIPSLHFL